MLKLKNAQALSRTEMKNLSGGADKQAPRNACASDCFQDPWEGSNYCPNGTCVMYWCGPDRDRDVGYRCIS